VRAEDGCNWLGVPAGPVYGRNCLGVRAGVRAYLARCTGRCAGVIAPVYGKEYGLYWLVERVYEEVYGRNFPGVRAGVRAYRHVVRGCVWA
jgi:hypothetical protein